MSDRLPLIVLAGSDMRSAGTPSGLSAQDALVGYKGALMLPNGQPLVGEMMTRFCASGRFLKPVLVGPAHVYEAFDLDCELVDSQGPFSHTLEQALQEVSRRYEKDAPVAFTACDILPSAQELSALMNDAYDPAAQSVFWSQLVQAEPQQMGASSWKPSYRFAIPNGESTNLYPGHLVVVRLAGLRFDMLLRLVDLAYRYRNRPLWQRAVGMTMNGIGGLAKQDLRNLLRLQPSVFMLSIPMCCISNYLHYLGRRFEVTDLEHVFTRVFVRRSAQSNAGARPVVFSVTKTVSFARDIDTRAELAEMTGSSS